jgi:valyl-tRNA synthetase
MQPIMPFVTQELWVQLAPPEGRDGLLMLESWPALGDELRAPDAEDEMAWVVRMVSEIRTVRSEMNVPPSAELPLTLTGASDSTITRLKTHKNLLARLARLAEISISDTVPAGAVQVIVDEATAALPIGDVIDVAQEVARLQKEIGKVDGEIAKIEKKLTNESFIAKAPATVVEEQRSRADDYRQSRTKLSEALDRLSTL